MTLKRGMQIIYVPYHARGDTSHPDCEQGFVVSVGGEIALCRFWSKFHSGLRTLANSEAVKKSQLVVEDSHEQAEVDRLLEVL